MIETSYASRYATDEELEEVADYFAVRLNKYKK